jgi:hypothetical protein
MELRNFHRYFEQRTGRSPALPWMFHEEAAKGALSLGTRGERLTQTLQPNQLWNDQSDRQVEAANAEIPRCPTHVRSSEANYLVVELSLTRKW